MPRFYFLHILRNDVESTSMSHAAVAESWSFAAKMLCDSWLWPLTVWYWIDGVCQVSTWPPWSRTVHHITWLRDNINNNSYNNNNNCIFLIFAPYLTIPCAFFYEIYEVGNFLSSEKCMLFIDLWCFDLEDSILISCQVRILLPSL